MRSEFVIINQSDSFKDSINSGTGGLENSFGSGVSESGGSENRATSKSFTEGLSSRAMSGLQRTALSPLNQATGGLAGQALNVGKAIAKGGGIAAAGGAIGSAAIWALQKGIQALEKRMAKQEAKADALNERDNGLIRAGTKSGPTFYKADLIRVTSTSRN